MRITFERSGGFGGFLIKREIDITNLSPNEANQLRSVIDAADFFHLPRTIVSRNPLPDRFQYTLTVEDNGKKHTVMVGEQSAPGNLRPLLDWLMAAARR